MEQPFTDILIRIRKGSRTSYPVEAWLSDGSFYEGKARLTKALRGQLLESDYAPVQYGKRLFNALFDGPIATAYDVATGLARQQGDGRLRIRLLLDESAPAELHALKWERMANLQGIPLAVSDLTPFSRYAALPEAELGPLDEPVVRLLFVVSAPSDLEAKGLAKIEVEDEVRRLLDALAEVWRSERCQATILPGQTGLSPELRADLEAAGCTIAGGKATLDNISERLRGQHVLHFLGHGQYRDGHGYLLLESEGGTLEEVVDTDLAIRLGNTPENEGGTLERVVDTDLAIRLGNTPVRLVFLAACESARRDAQPGDGAPQGSSFQGLAAKLVQDGGIPAVVAMQERIAIEAAYKLTGEFYRRLFLEHGVVDRALNEARALLFRQREMDWGTPVLSMRLKTGKLAIANPVWTALQSIREHPDYAVFRTGAYIPLPMQAALVNEGQDVSQYEQPEPQRIGTLDLMDAILGHLPASVFASTDHVSAAPLVLVLGGPSTSKSTQMKRLGWETLVRVLGRRRSTSKWTQMKRLSGETAETGFRVPVEQVLLPLYLDLQDFRPGGSATTEALEGQILDRLRLFLPELSARSLAELPKQMPDARLRLLFSAGDTLPEVGRDLVKLTVKLASRYSSHQYVLAIQPSALHWDDLEEVDQAQRCVLAIQPLEQRGIRHALEAQGESGQRLLDALYDTSLFDLASIPFFFVSMLIRARKGVTPVSRTEVLRQLIDEAIAQIPPDRGMRANAPRTLFEMACEMQRSDITIWPIGEAFRAMRSLRGERGYGVEELYESLVEGELLVPVGEKQAMRFAYSSIQAYCCARAIKALPERDRDRTLHEIVASLGSPVRVRWWEETLVLVCGLLARDAQQTLWRLLEPIILGADLLEGTRLFMGARCLLELRSVLDAQADPKAKALVDNVVNALVWRSDSANEPDLARRLQATQLLAQLAMPEVAVGLADKAYSMVRKNVANQWDYEFSKVRFAAAIALKRMAPDAAEAALDQINPRLFQLFTAWQRKDIDALIRYSEDSDDLGLQGLAALALGDLHGPLESANRTEDAKRALERLKEMFKSGETRQTVRWPVADALSLLDSARVTQEIVNPLLDELRTPDGTSLRNPAKIRKTLAYLIGLVRLRGERARDFLVRECLGLEGEERSKDWSTWATAIRAMGRIAAESDTSLLAEIAAGRAKGVELQEVFPQEVQRNYVRREAINALANQGDLAVLRPEDRDRIAKEPALSKAYYQAIQEIYWRREAAARAAQGGIL